MAAVFATTAAGLVIEGYVGHVFWKRRMERQAGRLWDHYVVCGHREAALHAVEELMAVRHPVVVAAEPSDSPRVGRPLDRSELLQGTRSLLPALRDRSGGRVYDPPDETAIEAGSTLILMGSPEDVERVRSNLGARLSEVRT